MPCRPIHVCENCGLRFECATRRQICVDLSMIIRDIDINNGEAYLAFYCGLDCMDEHFPAVDSDENEPIPSPPRLIRQ